jgi:hypothetical protein
MGEPAKAGPCVTDNGNFLVDVDFGTIADPEGLHKEIKLLAGVVETGLFINMAEKGSTTPLARHTHTHTHTHTTDTRDTLARARFCSRMGYYSFGVGVGVGGRSLLWSGGRNCVCHHQALSRGMTQRNEREREQFCFKSRSAGGIRLLLAVVVVVVVVVQEVAADFLPVTRPGLVGR